jgi:hypothetical protein
MLPRQYLKQVIVIALAVVAAAAPMAAARPMLDPQQQPVHVDRAADNAVRARAQALANHVPPNGRISTAAARDSAGVRLVTVTPSDGFDWGDAAIGAAAAAAIALLIAATGLAMRQRNQPRGIVS